MPWPFTPRVIQKFLDLANLQKHNDNYQDIADSLNSLAGSGRTTETIKGNADALANTYTKTQTDNKDMAVGVAAQAALDAHKASGDHDARYNTKTQLQTSGQSLVHWDNVSNKPNFADARWKAPVATFGDLPISGNSDGDVRLVLGDETVYEWDFSIVGTNKWRAIGAIGNGLTSHSSLTNLTNDDHPQYLNTGRGDLRYYLKSVIDTLLGTKLSQGGTLTEDLEFNKHEARNLIIHNSATAPADPAEGQPWYDITNHALMIYKGSVQGWVNVSGKGAVIRDQQWTALAGQTVFDITVGQYEINTNAITVYKMNTSTNTYEVVPEDDYEETDSLRFTLDTAAIGGEKYYVKFFENSPEVINQSVKRDGTLQVNLNSDLLHGHDDTYFAKSLDLGDKTSLLTTDKSSAVAAINEIVGSPAPTAVNLVNRLQVVTAPKGSPYNVLNIKGFTLVNLLGQQGRKVTAATVTGLDTTKTYAIINEDGTNVTVAGTSRAVPYKLTGVTSATLAWTTGKVAVYELPAGDLALTNAQLKAKYPYVDDVKHVNAPYVIKYGENLLPTFNEWTLHATVTATDPYTATQVATALTQDSYTTISIAQNQAYTITINGGVNSKYYVQELDSNGNSVTISAIKDVNASYTFTTQANSTKLNVYLRNGVATGTFTYSNPMLNLGSTAKPFKPRNDDILAFPNVQLASSVDGAAYDTLFKRDGKYFVEKRFKDMVLDGSLPYTTNVDFAGFKSVVLIGAFGQIASAVKYDGKILAIGSEATAADRITNYSPNYAISIADTDTGWGETYIPTAQEIQAYFYGWVMTTVESWNTAPVPYNGTGTKGWVRRWTPTTGGSKNDLGTIGSWITASGVTTVPNTPSSGFTPYKLTYQLATPTFEEIQVDAGMSLHEGLNQIEVGQGVVVREKVTPLSDGTMMYVNSIDQGFTASMLRNRLNKPISVHRNGRIDSNWKIVVNTYSYGNYLLTLPVKLFDPTATYEVSYIALDQYALSAPVQAVNGEVASNLKTVVDTVAANQADQDARISANEIVARRTYDIQRQIGNVLNPWGDNMQANRSRAFYTSNATQSISAATATKVSFQTAMVDNLSEFSSNRFTAKSAGIYVLQGMLAFSSGITTSVSYTVVVYKNGVAYRYLHANNGTSQAAPIIPYGASVDLNIGDYVEIYLITSSASVLGANSAFDITRIA